MSTVHIVGRALGFGPFRRQLCAWCGERLCDYDLRLMASSDGSEPGMWKEGDLLEVDSSDAGVVRSSVVAHEDGADIPLNCCASPPVTLRLVVPAPAGETKGGGE